MSIFTLIVGSTAFFTLVWWVWSHFLVRKTNRAWLWHGLIASFALLHLGGIAWFAYARLFLEKPKELPPTLVASILLWFIVVLPVTVLIWGAVGGWKATRWVVKKVRTKKTSPAAVASPSRRQFLTRALVAGPPLLQGGALIRGLTQVDDFRIQRLDVPFANLPRELDGARIAHVTDVHTGRFSDDRFLRRVVEATNNLRADTIMFTGDLIDYSLSDLSRALAMMTAFDAPAGVWMCEGNHDLFEGRDEFEQGTLKAGVNLLLDEARSVKIRGVDVQVLGQIWGGTLEEHGRAIARLVDRSRFSVLLAHHPHAFDPAREAGIDLTLAGHTHGGQLNLWPGIGPASLNFRYISGLYRLAGAGGKSAACMVSNGTGNWFPLRINSPAEIVEITLRRG